MSRKGTLENTEKLLGARVESKVSALVDELADQIAEEARSRGNDAKTVESLVRAFRLQTTAASKDALTAVLVNGVRRAQISVGR